MLSVPEMDIEFTLGSEVFIETPPFDFIYSGMHGALLIKHIIVVVMSSKSVLIT